MRQSLLFKIKESDLFKNKLLHWADNYSTILYLDSNDYSITEPNEFTFICAIGKADSIKGDSTSSFEDLKEYYNKSGDWIFGHLNYDLKNSIENLGSGNFDGLDIPEMHFFRPQLVFSLKGDELEVFYLENFHSKEDIKGILTEILETEINTDQNGSRKIKLEQRISKEEYLSKVISIKDHIQKGEIYELNFCQEFFAENKNIEPLDIFLQLKKVSPTPFSSYYKFEDYYLLSASPERFIRKKGNKIFSQPIKGTSKRGKSNKEDTQLKKELEFNPKERAENIMIVDLVRNDLSKTAIRGSVTVEEMCKIYTYPQVHQMISTITSTHNPDFHIIDIIKSAFPMGSMTGAPKVRAMELIEQYEVSKRGLFSGSVGYISPSGDFDFNVIIRSIIYNSGSKYISYQVGSAITNLSVPEEEYEECLIKAIAMNQSLSSGI